MDGFTLTARDVELFWRKVDQSAGPDACWPWQGNTMGRGYGLFDRKRQGKRGTWRAHRLAYEIAVGPIPAETPLLRHSCDNPPCCNPAHLRPGTPAENAADVVARGRHWTAVRPEVIPRGDDHWSRRTPEAVKRGEEHGGAKVTAEQVREIRRRYLGGGVSQRALAAEFGISQPLVWKIVTWQVWQDAR